MVSTTCVQRSCDQHKAQYKSYLDLCITCKWHALTISLPRSLQDPDHLLPQAWRVLFCGKTVACTYQVAGRIVSRAMESLWQRLINTALSAAGCAYHHQKAVSIPYSLSIPHSLTYRRNSMSRPATLRVSAHAESAQTVAGDPRPPATNRKLRFSIPTTLATAAAATVPPPPTVPVVAHKAHNLAPTTSPQSTERVRRTRAEYG
jgi:hypothetical protein